MKPEWFKDSIPLDPLIAPMVLFFQNNGIKTTQSCEGGVDHLYGRPTINFWASSMDYIEWVAELLKKNQLDTSLQVGLMAGFFSKKAQSEGHINGWYGLAQWVWGRGDGNFYVEEIYPRVIELVDMKVIKSITQKIKRK